MKRSINWDLIRQQYDQIVRYTIALRLGTAEADAILKSLTGGDLQHPTYQALVELGCAVKTIFLCQYLASEALRREIHQGLNVIESWHSANRFIFFGKDASLTASRIADQELSVLALHLLQNSLVYINTLMLQQILAEPRWLARMTAEDWRGLTPLFYAHVNPYGAFKLDMERRLPLQDFAA